MADKIRKMDDNTFNELFREGEIGLILLDGGKNLTPQQLKKVKEYAKIQSELKLQEMGAKLASQPGYKEFMMMPLISSIMKKSSIDKKVDATTSNVPISPQTTKIKKEKTKKKDINHSSIGPGPILNLRPGDSDTDIFARIYLLVQNEQLYYKKQSKIDKKYRKQMDDDKERRLYETIDAFNGKRPSAISGIARKISRSGLMKYGVIGALGVGGFLASKSALANINFDTILKDVMPDLPGMPKLPGFNDDDFESVSDDDARKSAENYLGRAMSDEEYDELIRATSAESGPKSNKKEQAGVMATILNRARDKNKTIPEILREKNQFQAVTGTEKKPGESVQFKQGPSEERRGDILSAATTILPGVSKEQKFFAAESDKAYGPGTSTTLRNNLRDEGGTVEGGTRFQTKIPDAIEPVRSDIISPIEGYNTKNISSHFGGRINPKTGQKENHPGIDMPVPIGTPVRAANSGKVTSGYSKGGGYYVQIEGDDGTITKYLHLNEIYKGDGNVNQGDVIAASGNSGALTTGPHLHFEVYKKNTFGELERQDPEKYIRLSSNTNIPMLNEIENILGLNNGTIHKNVTNIIQGSKTMATNFISKINKPILIEEQYYK
jgi:murein DD-endopeptidase MepM/ murein hydrolase activator NlpD